MRKLFLVGASAVLFAASTMAAQSEPSGATSENSEAGTKGAEHVEPGKVGPGSEKNSQV